MMKTNKEFPVGSWERPDAGGIVKRGEATDIPRYSDKFGQPPACFVGYSGSGLGCERESVMEAYGLHFCEVHGEQAAMSAFEEIYHDLEMRVIPEHSGLNPHVLHAFQRAMDSLPPDDGAAFDRTLLAAFPFDEKAREQILEDTRLYFQTPQSERYGYAPPYDSHRTDCVVICKHMRQAFEEGATWLVETLEKEREDSAAQTAWAVALAEELES